MPLPVFTWPQPCAGPHELYPHDHSWRPREGKYAGKQSCSGRFWCRRCWQWVDGKKCAPVRSAAA